MSAFFNPSAEEKLREMGHEVLFWLDVSFFKRGYCVNCGSKIDWHGNFMFMTLSGEVNCRSFSVDPEMNPLNGKLPFIKCKDAMVRDIIK